MTTSTTDAEVIARIIVDDFSDIIEVAKRCADRTRSTFVINRQHATTMIAGRILSYLASRREAVANDDIANALEKCDWSGASIGNKAIISAAIERLRENVLFCQDATDHLALIDYIADKIGLPKNEELSRENFATWLAASRREALEPVAWQMRVAGVWATYAHRPAWEPGIVVRPLYPAPPAPAGEVERSALEPVLSFLDELAANGQPGERKVFNPVLIGGSAKLYAEGLRAALNGGRGDE